MQNCGARSRPASAREGTGARSAPTAARRELVNSGRFSGPPRPFRRLLPTGGSALAYSRDSRASYLNIVYKLRLRGIHQHMSRLPRILICDDDSLYHLAIKHGLRGLYECRSAYDSDEALAILRGIAVDVVLLDIQ